MELKGKTLLVSIARPACRWTRASWSRLAGGRGHRRACAQQPALPGSARQLPGRGAGRGPSIGGLHPGSAAVHRGGGGGQAGRPARLRQHPRERRLVRGDASKDPTRPPRSPRCWPKSTLEVEPTPAVALESKRCLPGLPAGTSGPSRPAKLLNSRLEVTVLLDGVRTSSCRRGMMDVPVFKGTVTFAPRATSASSPINGQRLCPGRHPASRQKLTFEAPRDNAFSECDLILDLTGGTPLFPAHDRSGGTAIYRPDPDNPAAVQKAVFEIADMVGEFEKPRYVALRRRALRPFARSRKTGCTRCLDVCPTSAIYLGGATRWRSIPSSAPAAGLLRQRLPDRRDDLPVPGRPTRCSSGSARLLQLPTSRGGRTRTRSCCCTITQSRHRGDRHDRPSRDAACRAGSCPSRSTK